MNHSMEVWGVTDNLGEPKFSFLVKLGSSTEIPHEATKFRWVKVQSIKNFRLDGVVKYLYGSKNRNIGYNQKENSV